MSHVEVGLGPGCYRLIDLHCLKEMLNQMMMCSCQGLGGFRLFQNVPQQSENSFHFVLDLFCQHCSKKVSFGTSTIVDALGSALSVPDIDAKISNLISRNENINGINFSNDLWETLHNSNSKCFDTEHPVSEWLQENLQHSDMKNKSEDPFSQPTFQHVVVKNGPIDSLLDISPSFNPHLIRETSELINEEVHGPSHTNFNNKTCKYCGKLFKKSFNLKQHIRIHTNEKPLKCDKCNKRFNDRSSLNKHTRTVHIEFKPHVCYVCEKTFASTSHLNEHLVKHTNEKKFMCLKCEKRFAFRSSFKRHMAVCSKKT